MRKFMAVVVYMALMLGANPGLAAGGAADLATLLTGDLAKFVRHDAPVAMPEAIFARPDGTTGSLADHKGQWVLVNLWATWCAPCRVEMPMLAALQAAHGGDKFQVVTIATGRDSQAKVNRFMDQIEVTNLPRHTDPNQAFARAVKVLGLPVILLIDPEGREVARLIGPAKWDGADALALAASLSAD